MIFIKKNKVSTDTVKRCLLVLFSFMALCSFGQKVYFTDGYHGGVFGHFPEGYAKYIVNTFKKYPEWSINLEIEPISWDVVKERDNVSYQDFVKLYARSEKMDITNPSYAQSYLFNISGESVIRQFTYGIEENKKHFPNFKFNTYASEEPCFTSCLPLILKNLGADYAVLKNPNTCWGGYTSAFGGEIINWIGPDGTEITTSPTYEVESLSPFTTWQTIGFNNSKEYIRACFEYGMKHPMGMCYQDAGWKRGPWLQSLGEKSNLVYQNSEYTTWTNYFENIITESPKKDWNFSQEDIKVGLVWGSQVLQKIAQRVRVAENSIVQAEKIAAMAKIYEGGEWPKSEIDASWKNLLLAQHHDCWIVPYNKKNFSFFSKTDANQSWADWVVVWTSLARSNSANIVERSAVSFSNKEDREPSIRIFNTTGVSRKEIVVASIPASIKLKKMKLLNEKEKEISFQLLENKDELDNNQISFEVEVPSMGYQTYKFSKGAGRLKNKNSLIQLKNGDYFFENDVYQLTIDAVNGGVIKSLISKKNRNKEIVDTNNNRGFNELRGFFVEVNRFVSSMENPVKVKAIEEGELTTIIELEGELANNPYKQYITLTKGSERIDFRVAIDWKENTEIGKKTDFSLKKAYRLKRDKAFYQDRYKLQVLFPSVLSSPKIFKNAPFDVCESTLENTFYTSWDQIKHNVILNWVDLFDAENNKGLALFSDHTTSYNYGKGDPLGLTLQFSGRGLWGRNYTLTESSSVNYAIKPHANNWDTGGIEFESLKFNEPLLPVFVENGSLNKNTNSLVSTSNTAVQTSALYFEKNDLYVRFYNSSKMEASTNIKINLDFDSIEEILLNKQLVKKLSSMNEENSFNLKFTKHGIKTIKITNPKKGN